MKTKNLLPLLILGQSFLFTGHVLAQETVKVPAATNSNDEQELKKVNEEWGHNLGFLKHQFENANLRFSNRLDPISVNDMKAGIGYDYGTTPTIGGKFLSVDKWTIGLRYLPSSGFGSQGTREVTYIGVHNNHRDSAVRQFYNPITKLPTTADKALALNEKEFVGFRVPLTLYLSKEIVNEINSKLKATANVGFFTTGEVDVHVYRMPESRVRVRLFALKEKGVTASAGLKVFGYNRLTSLILDIEPGEVFVTSKKSDLFSVDYIFDLSKQEGKDQYNKLLGQKYSISVKNIKELTKATNPIQDSSEMKNIFYSDLEQIQNIANTEVSKNISDRSIIRLRTAENETNSVTQGFRMTFSKVLRLLVGRTDAVNKIEMTNIENNKKNYVLETMTKEFSYEILSLFGRQNKAESGLLTATDPKFNPQQVLGFQTRRYKKDLSFDKSEMDELKDKLTKNLPSDVLKNVNFPKWTFAKGPVKNVEIEQILFFNIPVLQSLGTITQAAVRQELTHLINNWGRFGSKPVNSEYAEIGTPDRQRLEDFHMKKYMSAYEQELELIPQLFTKVLNSNEKIADRLTTFSTLQNIPLFHEVGSALILRLVPQNRLAEAVNLRLSISGNDQDNVKGELSNYPTDSEKQELLNVVAAAVAETDHMTDRSFNVKLFINEQGESIGLPTLEKQAK